MMTINDVKQSNQILVDSYLLAPPSFFSKQMNISKDSLINLFGLWRTAIHSFLNENYTHHDAFVSENACHLRAAALIDLSLDHKLKESLLHISNRIYEIMERLQFVIINDNDIKGTILDFLIKHKLVFKIAENDLTSLKFIIDSYLLTLTKEELPRMGLTLCERTTIEPIKKIGFVKNKAKYLMSSAQKSLSAASCEYIQSEAEYLNDPAITQLLKIKFDAHQRSYVPQFIAGKVLIMRLLEKNRNIVIKIHRYSDYKKFDEVIICLRPNASKTDFELISSNVLSNTPCLVAEGSVNYSNQPENRKAYLERLLSYSFKDIFLATFASHPQYSGELKHLSPPFDEAINELEIELSKLGTHLDSQGNQKGILATIEKIQNEKIDYEQKKYYALRNGCSLDNPSLLFFNHIYADMIVNHLPTHSFNVDIHGLTNKLHPTDDYSYISQV